MKSLLTSEHIQELAQEESVRGVLVRTVLEQAANADDDEQALLEKALQLLLSRFQALEEEV